MAITTSTNQIHTITEMPVETSYSVEDLHGQRNKKVGRGRLVSGPAATTTQSSWDLRDRNNPYSPKGYQPRKQLSFTSSFRLGR